mmetsp:Transcript_120121/g.339942  ORF Transcript_120121/g.339942 Transcript_120121/m.339942 type:complete len:236 (-) Transcript_120121:4-711(-)
MPSTRTPTCKPNRLCGMSATTPSMLPSGKISPSFVSKPTSSNCTPANVALPKTPTLSEVGPEARPSSAWASGVNITEWVRPESKSIVRVRAPRAMSTNKYGPPTKSSCNLSTRSGTSTGPTSLRGGTAWRNPRNPRRQPPPPPGLLGHRPARLRPSVVTVEVPPCGGGKAAFCGVPTSRREACHPADQAQARHPAAKAIASNTTCRWHQRLARAASPRSDGIACNGRGLGAHATS